MTTPGTATVPAGWMAGWMAQAQPAWLHVLRPGRQAGDSPRVFARAPEPSTSAAAAVTRALPHLHSTTLLLDDSATRLRCGVRKKKEGKDEESTGSPSWLCAWHQLFFFKKSSVLSYTPAARLLKIKKKEKRKKSKPESNIFLFFFFFLPLPTMDYPTS